ncbi:hypothetical protein HOO65_070301 [Ceratocystis lukuohia]|uniref:Telomere-associated protein Rif1 N-terminal domain-containing protein n=1 Tax=Ceratocystis lukuohia TaxID=2019550 RepID=A0ABR4MC29_9PEZI
MAAVSLEPSSPGAIRSSLARSPTPPLETKESEDTINSTVAIDRSTTRNSAKKPVPSMADIPVSSPTLPLSSTSVPPATLHVTSADNGNGAPRNFSPPKIGSPHTPGGDQSTRRIPKSVVFSGKAQYQDAPIYDTDEFRPSPSLLPSRTLKPLRGILKASPLPVHIEHLNSSKVSLAVMLDSAIKQLNGTDKTSRIEAYSTLYRALKASNNLPDRMALNEKMGIILKFLQRDIKTPPSRDPTDHSLVINALLMFLTFLYFPSISATIPADFGIFIIEHCIKSFEDRRLGKEVIRNLMQVVFSQNFPARVMSSERLRRLIIALHNLDQHMGSSKILIFRARIYKRLIKQCRSHMIAHPDWMPDLFTDMLSSVKEVRYAAMDFGYEAALSLGMEKEITVRVLQLLSSQETERSRTYLDFYVEKLSAQFSKKPVAAEDADGGTGEDTKLKDMCMVSKIWTIVMLLVRSRPLDRWEALPKWLNLIPPCFNSSDLACRLEANIAWSRFIYVAHLQEAYFGRMLSQAIVRAYISQLSRRQFGRKSEADFRKAVLGGVCSVYYYAFGANTPTKLLDKYWDFTLPLFNTMTSTEAHPESRECAVSIMCSLLDTSSTRLWDEKLVLGVAAYPDPDMIPCLDLRWIRRNLMKVGKVLIPIIEGEILQLSDFSSSSNKLCCVLSATVCGLAAKEIKVSSETLDYLSFVLATIGHLWQKGVPEATVQGDNRSSAFLCGMKFYIMLAIDGLGLLPFMEPITAEGQTTLSGFRDAFSLCTPQKPWSNRLELLLSTLCVTPPGIEDGTEYAEFLEAVFKPFLGDKEALAVLSLMQSKLTTKSGPMLPDEWLLAVRTFVLTLLSKRPAQAGTDQSSSDVPLGREYKNMTKALELGLKSCPELAWHDWERYFKLLAQHIFEFVGSTGMALALLEPLSKFLLGHLEDTKDAPPLNSLMAAIVVVRNACQPSDRQAVESAHRRLWGVPATKASTLELFSNLYAMLNALLRKSYTQYPDYNQEQFVDSLFRDLDAFLERCLPSLVVQTANTLQPGLVHWVRDEKKQLDGPLHIIAKSLVTHICTIISRNGAAQFPLATFEPLLCAGFQSSHADTVNSFVSMWNRLYENVDDLEYPQNLKDILVNLRTNVSIVLPGLENSGDASLVSFRHTQSFVNGVGISAVSPVMPSNGGVWPSTGTTGSLNTAASVVASATTVAAGSLTNKTLDKSDSPARARHDNSQIDFVSIQATDNGHGYDENASQVLTDRQREVRDRQRENAHFVPSTLRIATSDASQLAANRSAIDGDGSVPGTPVRSDVDPVSTPKTSRSYEDYLSSTPTPVRTSKANLIDQDMSDVPSSPLEESSVRRYPLIPDMHNRPDAHLKEDWPEFSSPVNSSPIQPQRLTRSQKRAAESQNSASQDQEITDADSLPVHGLLSSSIPSSLFEMANIKAEAANEDEDDLTPKAFNQPQRNNYSSARKSISQLPPLTMTTRSASRSQPMPSLSDMSSPASSPLKRISHRVNEKSKKTEAMMESQLESVEPESATRSRKRRRRSSIPETPSQISGTSEKTLRHRSILLEATPTPARKHKRRQGTAVSEQSPQEPDASGQQGSRTEATPTHGDDSDPADDVSIPATPASATRTSCAGSTPGPRSSNFGADDDDNDNVTPLTRSNRKRKRKRGANRSSRKRKRLASEEGSGDVSCDKPQSFAQEACQESESSQELDPETQVSLDNIDLKSTPEVETLATPKPDTEQQESRELSSPLSDLPDSDSTPVLGSSILPMSMTPTPVTRKKPEIVHSAATTVSDEEAESQVLSELAASRGGLNRLDHGRVDPVSEKNNATTNDEMDVDSNEELDAAFQAPTSTEAVAAAALKAEEEIGNLGPLMPHPGTPGGLHEVSQPIAANSATEIAEQAQAGNSASSTPGSIMGLLRNGLQSLRQMRLSRQDMYQIEDLFVDFKRELYDAERRGRE